MCGVCVKHLKRCKTSNCRLSVCVCACLALVLCVRAHKWGHLVTLHSAVDVSRVWASQDCALPLARGLYILYNLLQLYKGKCPFDVPAMVNPGIYMVFISSQHGVGLNRDPQLWVTVIIIFFLWTLWRYDGGTISCSSTHHGYTKSTSGLTDSSKALT